MEIEPGLMELMKIIDIFSIPDPDKDIIPRDKDGRPFFKKIFFGEDGRPLCDKEHEPLIRPGRRTVSSNEDFDIIFEQELDRAKRITPIITQRTFIETEIKYIKSLLEAIEKEIRNYYKNKIYLIAKEFVDRYLPERLESLEQTKFEVKESRALTVQEIALYCAYMGISVHRTGNIPSKVKELFGSVSNNNLHNHYCIFSHPKNRYQNFETVSLAKHQLNRIQKVIPFLTDNKAKKLAEDEFKSLKIKIESQIT